VDKEVELIDLKKGRFEENRTYYLSEKEALDQSISDLRAGLANNVIQYKDKETGQIITTTSSSTRRALQKELDEAVESRNEISQKLEVVTDSITSLEIKRLDVQSNSEVASELGPLKYISELTNTPMSKVVNILMLVIIFVFDPLAISLVIAANFAFNRLRKKGNEEPQPKVKEPVDVDNEFSDLLDLQDTKSENWSEDLPEEVLDEILAGEIFVVDNEKEPQPINPTDEDIEKLKEQLDKIENSKKEVSIEETPEETTKEETPKPQIKTLRYQPRNARNTRIDRI